MFSTTQMGERSIRRYRKMIRIYHPMDQCSNSTARNWAYLSAEVFRHLGMPQHVEVEYNEDTGYLKFRPSLASDTALTVWKSNGSCTGNVSLGSFMNFCGVNRLKPKRYSATCVFEQDTPVAIIYVEQEGVCKTL